MFLLFFAGIEMETVRTDVVCIPLASFFLFRSLFLSAPAAL